VDAVSHRTAAADVDTRDALEAQHDAALRRGDRAEAARLLRELDALDAAQAVERRLGQRSRDLAQADKATAERQQKEAAEQTEQARIRDLKSRRPRQAVKIEAAAVRLRAEIEQLQAIDRDLYAATHESRYRRETLRDWLLWSLGFERGTASIRVPLVKLYTPTPTTEAP
jgi:hypothetical protein